MAKDSKDLATSEDEIFYIIVKDESDNDNEEDDEMALISHVSKNDTWIIDSGCSHHMTGDMGKFVKFDSYDGGIVRVGNNVACHIKGMGSVGTIENMLFVGCFLPCCLNLPRFSRFVSKCSTKH